MGVLQRFERRVETLVNGAFARAFKSEVQPVEIAAALQREADDKAQVLSRERVMVPNAYVVELSPHDGDRLSPWAGPLQAELAAMVAEHAEAQRYTPMGSLRVEFETHPDLETGIFRIRSRGDSAPVGVRVDPRRFASAQPPGGQPPAYAYPASFAPAPPNPQERTALYAAASPEQSWLEVEGARVPLADGVTVIGRGSEADLRLEDPGVSRRHAQLQLAGGHARLMDLGSTNGTVVDGRRVRDVALRDGDEFVLGRSRVVFRHGPGEAGGEDAGALVPGLR